MLFYDVSFFFFSFLYFLSFFLPSFFLSFPESLSSWFCLSLYFLDSLFLSLLVSCAISFFSFTLSYLYFFFLHSFFHSFFHSFSLCFSLSFYCLLLLDDSQTWPFSFKQIRTTKYTNFRSGKDSTRHRLGTCNLQ